MARTITSQLDTGAFRWLLPIANFWPLCFDSSLLVKTITAGGWRGQNVRNPGILFFSYSKIAFTKSTGIVFDWSRKVQPVEGPANGSIDPCRPPWILLGAQRQAGHSTVPSGRVPRGKRLPNSIFLGWQKDQISLLLQNRRPHTC